MSSSAKKGARKSTRNDSGGSSNAGDVHDSGNNIEKDNDGRGDEDGEVEPGSWECTVCTFRNRYEAFKCLMCDTRKGTSTRKPRLNPSVVQQQTLVQKLAVEVEKAQQKKQRNSAEMVVRNSPECFSPCTSSMANSPKPTRAPSVNGLSQKQSKSLIRRRPISFRDALVVRSAAKKMVVTVNGVSFTVTEFKPRTSPRGRKKLPANQNNSSSSSRHITIGAMSNGTKSTE
uniref:RanBP2-type domain-containing protein n=2 Tax=Globodera pallida TaxID=36090 RepID=A0A183BSE8_GLOPA